MKKPAYPKLMSIMALHGETLADLVAVIHLSVPSISNKVNGKTEWTITEIDAICRHYDLSYDELFTK